MDEDDKKYKCTLDEASLAVAAKELNELPSDRLNSVQAFRKWIKQQKTIRCPTDTKFLLKFLRTGKFSQIAARERLQGYLKQKTKIPEFFDNIDTHNKALIYLLKSGFALPLGFDPNGKYTFIFRQGAVETSNKNYQFRDIWYGMFVMLFYCLEDERAVVNGINWIADFTGFEMRHFAFWGVDSMHKWMHVFQKNYPARFKCFQVYNAGIVFDKIMTVITPLMTKKMKERLFLHGSNLESIYKLFPQSMLPREYLPDEYDGPCPGTMQEISDKLVAELTSPEWRQKLLDWSSPKWGIDLKEKADTAAASFRKMTIDDDRQFAS